MKGPVTIGLLLAASLALSACGKSGEMTPSPAAPGQAGSASAPPSMPPPAATAPMPSSSAAAPSSASTAGNQADPQH